MHACTRAGQGHWLARIEARELHDVGDRLTRDPLPGEVADLAALGFPTPRDGEGWRVTVTKLSDGSHLRQYQRGSRRWAYRTLVTPERGAL